MRTVPARTVVIGVGNVLLKDEGIGVHVVRQLQKTTLPPGVVAIDGGTAGLELLELVDGAGKLIIVDSIQAGAEAGAVFEFGPFDIDTVVPGGRLSLHRMGLLEVLRVGRALGRLPETVRIIGVQPHQIDFGEELSPLLAQRLPQITSLVIQNLS